MMVLWTHVPTRIHCGMEMVGDGGGEGEGG